MVQVRKVLCLDLPLPIAWTSTANLLLIMWLFIPFVFVLTVPPKISNISSDVTVNEGSNVTLVCMANGRPEPVITWRHLTPTGKQLSRPQDTTHRLKYPHASVIPLDPKGKAVYCY